jgi:hypothetical protein
MAVFERRATAQAHAFPGRSYMAFALTQEPPIVDWLAELDRVRSSAVVEAWLNRTPL